MFWVPREMCGQIFPRISALSEVLWSPKEVRNLEDFKARLPVMIKRYKMWGANYFSGN